jgi:hypothetical protein
VHLEKQHLSCNGSGFGRTLLQQLFSRCSTCIKDGTASLASVGMDVLLKHAMLIVNVLSGWQKRALWLHSGIKCLASTFGKQANCQMMNDLGL